MKNYWIGIDSDERVAIAAAMRSAIADFVGAGVARIEAACNRRRLWLQAQANSTFVQARGIATATILGELGPAFQLRLPDRLTIEFRYNRREPAAYRDCPMVHENRVVSVWPEAIDTTNPTAPHALGLTARQITFHELLHACGDWQGDGVVRHNWAGIGAIVRELAGLPVDVDDSPRPLEG